MAQTLKPPAPLPPAGGTPSVFLAGSIEMGAAEDWQARLTHALQDLDVLILNPRRDEWDASWVHTRGSVLQRVFSHDVYHSAQVNETLRSAGLPQIDLWD